MASRMTQTNGDLAGTLAQMGGTIVKVVNDEMNKKMLEVQKEAKNRAPLDHGNLENAIKLDKQNQRRSWTVYVDESLPDDTGKYTIGTYAMLMHEGVGINWGAKTLAKGSLAGRKFLENPFKEIITQKLLDRLEDLLSDEIAKRRVGR